MTKNLEAEKISGKGNDIGLEKTSQNDGQDLVAKKAATVAAKKAFDDAALKWTEPLKARLLKLNLVGDEEKVVAAGWAALLAKEGEITLALGAEQKAREALLAAVVACKSAQYDKFRSVLAAAVTDREQKLVAIQKLIKAPIAMGKDGGRCEKPMTNGDWARRGKCEDPEKMCCGAATGTAPNGATMTLEVC